MKKIFIIVCATIGVLQLNAQDNLPSSFKILNSEKIYWENVYETDLSKEEVLEYFICEQSLGFTEVKPNKYITAIIGDAIIPLNKKNDPNIIPSFLDPMSCYVIIEFKDNRYRIIATDITFTMKAGFMVDGWGFAGDKEKGLDGKMIKKGIINPSKSDYYSIRYLDSYLIQKFSIRERFSNDW